MENGSFLEKSAKQGDTKRGVLAIVTGVKEKFFNFFNEAETKGRKNAIVNSVGIKIFEKSSKKVLQNRGGNLDNQWCGEDFLIFSKSSNATGGCFGNNPGRGAMLFLKKNQKRCNKMGWQS